MPGVGRQFIVCRKIVLSQEAHETLYNNSHWYQIRLALLIYTSCHSKVLAFLSKKLLGIVVPLWITFKRSIPTLPCLRTIVLCFSLQLNPMPICLSSPFSWRMWGKLFELVSFITIVPTTLIDLFSSWNPISPRRSSRKF